MFDRRHDGPGAKSAGPGGDRHSPSLPMAPQRSIHDASSKPTSVQPPCSSSETFHEESLNTTSPPNRRLAREILLWLCVRSRVTLPAPCGQLASLQVLHSRAPGTLPCTRPSADISLSTPVTLPATAAGTSLIASIDLAWQCDLPARPPCASRYARTPTASSHVIAANPPSTRQRKDDFRGRALGLAEAGATSIRRLGDGPAGRGSSLCPGTRLWRGRYGTGDRYAQRRRHLGRALVSAFRGLSTSPVRRPWRAHVGTPLRTLRSRFGSFSICCRITASGVSPLNGTSPVSIW